MTEFRPYGVAWIRGQWLIRMGVLPGHHWADAYHLIRRATNYPAKGAYELSKWAAQQHVFPEWVVDPFSKDMLKRPFSKGVHGAFRSYRVPRPMDCPSAVEGGVVRFERYDVGT